MHSRYCLPPTGFMHGRLVVAIDIEQLTTALLFNVVLFDAFEPLQ